MTATSLDQFIDTNPDGSFDHTPPCDTQHCDQAATWILWRVQCCPDLPTHILVCEPCRRIIFEPPAQSCGHCERLFDPTSTAFTRVEAI